MSKSNNGLKGLTNQTLANKKKFIIIIAITAVYMLLQLCLVATHAPWRDEALAWLISRDLSIPGIILHSFYEGHPTLWYLLLWPFSHLGLPYYPTMNIIAVVIISATVFLILWKAPFSNAVKFFAITGTAFMYHYSVIARSYCLIALMAVLTAIYYEKRKEHPYLYAIMLTLLLQTHLLIVAAAGMLMLFAACERLKLVFEYKKAGNKEALSQELKRTGGIFAIFTVGGVLFLLPVLGMLSVNKSMDVRSYNIKELVAKCYNTFIDILRILTDVDFSVFYLNNAINYISGAVVFILLLLAAYFWFRYHWQSCVLMFASLVFQIIIYIKAMYNGIRFSLILMMIFLLCIWLMHIDKKPDKDIAKAKGESHKVYIVAVLIFIAMNSMSYTIWSREYTNEFKYLYSDSKPAAEYILENLPEDATIVTNSEVHQVAVAAYLKPGIMWSPIRQEYISFTIWDDKYLETVTFNQVIEGLQKAGIDLGKVYLLDTRSKETDQIVDLDQYIGTKLIEIGKWEEGYMDDEHCYLYKLQY